VAEALTPLQHLALEVLHLMERIEVLERRDQPITPLYSLDQACTLLPTSIRSLHCMLQRYRADLDPVMYRHGPRHRRYRMLSHRDMLTLRARLIRRPGHRTRAQVIRDLSVA
jgi:hypothetical protein